MKKHIFSYSTAGVFIVTLSFILQSFNSDYKPFDDPSIKCRKSTNEHDYCVVGDHQFKFGCANNTVTDDCKAIIQE